MGWMILFDHNEPALIFDIDRIDEKVVVAEPTPHYWILKPSYHGIYYTGQEWPFNVYKTLCSNWARTRGFVLPK